MTPTEMGALVRLFPRWVTLWSRENWRSNEMSDPLPNGWFTLAWNATVGKSLERIWSQRAVTHRGTRSHLLSTKTKCLYFFSVRMYSSTKALRVPIGSRASSTYRTTSALSMTLCSSFQIRVDWPFLKSLRLFVASWRDPSASETTRLRSTRRLFGAAYVSCLSAAAVASCSTLERAPSFTRLRLALSPKVSDQRISCLGSRCLFLGSWRRDSGNFPCRTMTEYGSW
mmetsp:Transcript_3560/g.11105  ORF Transcript_3560/g.11105 Transcript_3560/m.11105 type:complete len:227 (-) Transcript_3560:337-1017(-)